MKTQEYTTQEIADWILSKVDTEKGDTISPLKLQKLLYYCQAWHYTIFKKALFSEDFQAWAHGPVAPSQYARFVGKSQIKESIDVTNTTMKIPELPEHTEELLNDVMNVYGKYDGSYLEELTHAEKPWIEARGNTAPGMASKAIITLESMEEYYSTLLKK